MANNLLNHTVRFLNLDLILVRAAELGHPVPPIDLYTTGMNAAAMSPVGITELNPGLDESESWTLLDQSEQPRTPQAQMHIAGGYGDGKTLYGDGAVPGTDNVDIITSNPAGEGRASEIHGEATLADLAVGWTAVIPP